MNESKSTTVRNGPVQTNTNANRQLSLPPAERQYANVAANPGRPPVVPLSVASRTDKSKKCADAEPAKVKKRKNALEPGSIYRCSPYIMLFP